MHVGKKIQEVMKQQGRTARWLAAQIPCDRRNVYYIYRNASIDTTLLARISVLLDYDFFKELSEEVKGKI